MAHPTRYLLTADSQTGVVLKLERMGEAGELTELPLSALAVESPPGAGSSGGHPVKLRIQPPGVIPTGGGHSMAGKGERLAPSMVIPTGGGNIDEAPRAPAPDLVPTGGGNKK